MYEIPPQSANLHQFVPPTLVALTDHEITTITPVLVQEVQLIDIENVEKGVIVEYADR